MNSRADENAIKGIFDRYATIVNAGDFDGWLSLWADHGVQLPDGAPARVGKEQIREAMRPVFDGMDLDVTIHGVQDLQVWGDRAVTRSTWSLAMTPKGGGETISAMSDAKALTVFERQSDGTWRIVFDCFNSNVPSAEG